MSIEGSRAVFLDRDGIINYSVVRDGKPYPPSNLQEFCYVDGIKEVLLELQRKGFQLYIVTNQPDVARGTTPRSIAESFHSKVLIDLPIKKIYTCYHDDSDKCDCRKPKPGMLYQAKSDFAVNLEGSFLVGDRWRDIDCGSQAGCTTIFVDYGYEESLKAQPSFVVKGVREVLEYIK